MKTKELPLWFWVLGAAIVASGLSSCAPMPVQSIVKGVAYKYDMIVTVDGITRTGMLVAPRKDTHQISIKAQGDLDLFTYETCHREIDTENASTPIFIGQNHREYSFTYSPSPLIETTGYCPMKLNGFTNDQDGQSSWGFIDFEDPDTVLPAEMQCDGAPPYGSNGVTICQSKQGTIQRITFPAKVVFTPDPGCEIDPKNVSADGKEIVFPIDAGLCVYNFTEVAPLGKQRLHRLTTYGFSQIILHAQGN